jgi:hypothetical protein
LIPSTIASTISNFRPPAETAALFLYSCHGLSN